ncbi:MAG: hypothetical protein WCI36_02400 [bacterium]
MPLDNLNRELYESNADKIESRSHDNSAYDPSVSVASSSSPFDENKNWNQPQRGLTPEKKRNIWIFIGVFVFLLLAVSGTVFYRWWMKNAFHQDRVSISFEGPKEADSNQPTKYIIHYSNSNRVTLKNTEIQITYSENFQPIDSLNLKYINNTTSKIFIGDIAPMSVGQAEFKGVFYAPKDFPVFLHAEIDFTPSNAVEKLSMTDQISVNIAAAPVVVSVAGPQQLVNGDSMEYVIEYKNLDTRVLSDIQLRVDFPVDFQLKDSQPKSSEKGSYWYVGNLEPGQSGKINIQGKINGGGDEGKSIVVSLGHIGEGAKFVIYDKQELTTRIVSPVLRIFQRVEEKNNEIVKAGEVIKYAVTFENTGDITLRDAIINVEIKGNVLDFSKMNIDKGSYDNAKNIITWKASDVPILANINPGATGFVRFSVPVKNTIPIENKLDKNFIVSSVAKIDSPDIPTPINSNKIIGSNKLELKLASKVIFDTKGYYFDSKVKNVGPMPMESNKETTFSLHWQLINVSNDITSVKIISSLPSGVRWVGELIPSTEKVSYNERTNQIIWDAGDISAGTGVLGLPREIIFKVAVTPQNNQIGEPINLLNPSSLTAKDAFTGEDIVLSGEKKNTMLPEDKFVGFSNGKVLK